MASTPVPVPALVPFVAVLPVVFDVPAALLDVPVFVPEVVFVPLAVLPVVPVFVPVVVLLVVPVLLPVVVFAPAVPVVVVLFEVVVFDVVFGVVDEELTPLVVVVLGEFVGAADFPMAARNAAASLASITPL